MPQVPIRQVAGTDILGSDLTRLRKTPYAPTQNALRGYAKWSAINLEGAGRKQDRSRINAMYYTFQTAKYQMIILKSSRDSRINLNFCIDILLSALRFQQFGVFTLRPFVQLFPGGIVRQTGLVFE